MISQSEIQTGVNTSEGGQSSGLKNKFNLSERWQKHQEWPDQQFGTKRRNPLASSVIAKEERTQLKLMMAEFSGELKPFCNIQPHQKLLKQIYHFQSQQSRDTLRNGKTEDYNKVRWWTLIDGHTFCIDSVKYCKTDFTVQNSYHQKHTVKAI